MRPNASVQRRRVSDVRCSRLLAGFLISLWSLVISVIFKFRFQIRHHLEERLGLGDSARWEARREAFEATVREATVEVPEAAHAVVVSLDGVMAPMRGGYREAGSATVSLVDGDGEWLHSVCMGRMPESNKTALKTMFAAEDEAVLRLRFGVPRLVR